MNHQTLSLLLLLCVLAFNPLAAGELFVDRTHPQASDANSGSEDLPWRTIQHAADAASPGDRVLVKAGVYPEAVTIQGRGNATSWIEFAAYQDHVVTIDGSSVSLLEQQGLVSIASAGHVRFEGFRVENAGPHGTNTGIDVTGSDHVIVAGNRTENTASSGILVWSSSDVTVKSNEIVGACSLDEASENECLSVGESTRVEIFDNHVHHGSSVRGEGIDVKDGSSHVTVRGNHVHDVMFVGIYVDAWDKSTHDIAVDGNLVHDIKGDAFSIGSEQGGLLERVRLTNNIAYDCLWTGLNLHQCCIASHPLDTIEVVNNTFADNGIGDWGGGILVENDQADGVVLRNNLVSGNLSFQIALEIADTSGITVDHNLIDVYRSYEGETRGDDAIEGDPLFVDAAAHDYRLTTPSPAIDTGAEALAPESDYDGVDRPQGAATDIGAFEFVAGPPPGSTFRYALAGVAHQPGAGGTQWRTDVTALNPGDTAASLILRFQPLEGSVRNSDATLTAGSTSTWQDVLVGVFGLAPGDRSSGALIVESTAPIILTSRTYSQTTEGTFGQFLPGVAAGACLGTGRTGYLSQIRGTPGFRTNVGVVNAGDTATSVRFLLHDSAGDPTGDPIPLTVDSGAWRQVNDIIDAAGIETLEHGYVTVEVTSGEGLVWSYASVVDNRTGDATTVPMAFHPVPVGHRLRF